MYCELIVSLWKAQSIEFGMAGYLADCAVFADCEIVRLKLCRLGPMEAVVLIVGCWPYVSQLVWLLYLMRPIVTL